MGSLVCVQHTVWSRNAAALQERMHHGHVHVQIVCLLEALAADHTGELQVRLRLVLGHVILERGPLAALEAAHLAPETHTDAVSGAPRHRRQRSGSYSLQRFGSGVTHLMHRQMLPLLERLTALITDVVPHLCQQHNTRP